ncbi:LysR family transcriptional regulator [Sphingomonas sp.]|uniref:LysR family transcriptional regulator n=1 Tax=Sphingomonas sp. TaxID=28214 RepID=UPI001848AE2D|nr:LysR family transcriptional regulator [Sphingomonas sp.]MBA3512651.1 LysR family transcriptional regulator [Sphingomonas sp.]
MELFQIRYVLAAAETLNFTRAAERCNVSQPALTKAVKNLEQELGTPIFTREGKRVRLSDFGRSILPTLRQMQDQAERAKAIAQEHRLLDKVPVRLGVLGTIGSVRIARYLATFQSAFEGVEVEVIESPVPELLNRLDEGALDLAIVNPCDGVPESFHAHPLYTEKYVAVLPPGHPLAERNSVRLKDLSGQPYVDRLSCEMREMFTAVCRDLDVQLYARFRSEREDWVQAMVLANIGIAVMPEYSVTVPDLLQRPITDPAISRTIALVTVPGRPFAQSTAAFVRTAKAFSWPG